MPNDTTIRRGLDQLSPVVLRLCYRVVFRYAQRQKLLEQFRRPLDGLLLLAIDGTQEVSSPTIHCSSCLVKQHRPLDPDDPDESERFTSYHQTLEAALVSSTSKTVLPLGPEPIAGRDEHGVQDSELKAAILEARLRWRIENACFRTLKDSHGPDFEHNHGYGTQHLAIIISLVAMWQQLVEQVCEHLCPWYQAALFGLLKKPRPKLHF